MNGEGQWRPNGTNLPWRSTVTDTDPLTMSAVKIKPEPEHAPDCEPLPCSHDTGLQLSSACIECTCYANVLTALECSFYAKALTALESPVIQTS